MCGIAGFTWEDPTALGRMTDALKHRGPNAEGFHTAPGISLGHRRLSIIDLSQAANQPMTSADGRYTIVYNGEIYNYKSIRSTLESRGIRFKTQSDTEVLLEALAAWGSDALIRLNGMFAFALWDKQTSTLTLARDQIGIKPLYWTRIGSNLAFASEAKALLTHPEVPRTLNRATLSTFLRFQYVPSPETLWQHIHKVAPGTFLRIQGGNMETHRYWMPTPGTPFPDVATARQEIAQAARAAVKDQLVSDVPLGVFLSGGVDSTAVLGLMREAQGSGTIKTFSIGFEAQLEKEKYNADAVAAEQTARFYGTDHRRITMNGCDVAAAFERMIWHMDEPIGNPIQAATLLLAQHARPEITVALGGDGGDELFGGYDRYWIAAQLEMFERLPPAAQSVLQHALMATGHWPAIADKLRHPSGLARYLAFMAQKEEGLQSLLLPEARSDTPPPQAFHALLSGTVTDLAGLMMRTDLATWLPDESLLRTDKMTMAFGLEQRVPLLDMRMVEAAMRTPTAWKLGSRTQGKRILRQALAAYLPPHIRKQKKRGFFSPTAKWLRGELLPLAREVLAPGYAKATEDLLNFPEIERLLNDHVAARRYGLPLLWSLMSLQGWARRFDITP